MTPFFAFTSAATVDTALHGASAVTAPLAPASPAFPLLQSDALQTHILTFLKEHHLLKTGRSTRLIVAYSGGKDSTALLHALSSLRNLANLDIVAAYFHHNWRGTPPPELPRLHKNCQTFRIPLVFMPPTTTHEQSTNEASAREQRYERLNQLAQQLEADAVCTAHHQDDQLETMLFRLVRGTGMDGLVGMHPTRTLHDSNGPTLLARPLLTISRQQIDSYIEQHQLLSFEDPTNQDVQKARNWLRHQALPLLEGRFPQLRQSLLRLGTTLENDRYIVEQVIQEHWNNLCLPTGQALPSVYRQGPTLDAIRLQQLALPYQHRLLRHYLKEQGLEPDLKTIEHILLFLGQGQVGQTHARRFSLGTRTLNQHDASHAYTRLFLVKAGSQLWMEAVPTQLHDAEIQKRQQQVSCPLTGGCVAYPWDASKALRIEPWPKRAGHFDVKKLLPAGGSEVFVNASSIEHQTLTLRTRRPGDWIAPLGMGGKKMKLKDVFIHHKIPQPLRDTWPVVAIADTNQLVWIPTIVLSDVLRSTSKQSPTHTWMVGDTSTLEQLRTLRIIVDAPTSDETPSLDLELDTLDGTSLIGDTPSLKAQKNLLADDDDELASLEALTEDDEPESP